MKTSSCNFIKTKKKFFNAIDERARKLIELFKRDGKITKNILESIIELYKANKIESTDNFTCAYQESITSSLEYFIARILYWFVKTEKLNLNIDLRRQTTEKNGQSKLTSTPDIRIYKNNKTLALIEIKAKAGWMQFYFSKKRKKLDLQKEKEGKTKEKFAEKIQKISYQFDKYKNTFNIDKNQIFVLLPTFAHVSRVKKYVEEIEDFKKQFTKHSKIPEKNLIVLSKNRLLNLQKPKNELLAETQEFEKLLETIKRMEKTNRAGGKKGV